VQDLTLGGLPDQLVVDRLDRTGGSLDNIPLGRGRQGNAQVPLQPLQPVEGQPRPVFQQGDHARRRRIVLLVPDSLGRGRGEHLAAEVATQLLQFVDLGLERCLAGDPDQHAGLGLFVDRTFLALRAGIARTKGGVRYRDPLGTFVIIGAVTAVAFGRRGRFLLQVGVLGRLVAVWCS